MKALLILIICLFTGQSILDREYYKTLNVPISAGPDQIRDAFLKLSRKYHPDRNPNSRKRFEKINVAYETLSNQNRKYLYDRLGKQKMNDPNIQQEKKMQTLKGGDINIPLTLTLQDIYNGKSITGTIFKKMACPHCLGSGAQNQYDIVRCSDCQGQGRKSKKVHVGNGHYSMMTQPCTRCSGRGKIVGRKCSTCQGNRIVSGGEELKIKIAPGIFGGEVIKYFNMGDELDEGAPGDLIINIHEAPHKRFARDGNNLRTEIEISLKQVTHILKQALFGFKRSISQLDGRKLDIERVQITQPGQQLTIPGQGFQLKNSNQKGNLIIKVNVSIHNFTADNLNELKNLLDQIDQ